MFIIVVMYIVRIRWRNFGHSRALVRTQLPPHNHRPRLPARPADRPGHLQPDQSHHRREQRRRDARDRDLGHRHQILFPLGRADGGHRHKGRQEGRHQARGLHRGGREALRAHREDPRR